MNTQDEKIRFEILTSLYRKFEQDPLHSELSNDDLSDEHNNFEKDDINYVIDRIDGEHADVQSYMGGLRDVEITARGIEHLSKQGVETILDNSLRYELLRNAYEADREGRGAFVDIPEFIDDIGATEKETLCNVEYLKQKRLIELFNGYNGIQITDRGREKFESYRDDGVDIPSNSISQSTKQAEIGRGDSQKAENLFRDIVELTSEEVRILDRYAKTGLFEWINAYVPTDVSVKVLTSGRVTGGTYADDISDELNESIDVEVRKLPNSDWDFHDRYIFRDEDMGWSWGHSFHDSGDRQHTASELKPVNRERISKKFDETWERADRVV